MTTDIRISAKATTLLALALAALGAGASALHAQVPPAPRTPIERNEPPTAPRSTQPAIQLNQQDQLAGSTDTTPLGASVTGIRLLGPNESPDLQPPSGITIGAISGVSEADLHIALAPFLGKPLSRKLISDAQAAVARVYRESGYPFVSITLPPHEATGGTFQLRVVEFRLGKVSVNGAGGADDKTNQNLARDLRVTGGDRIDARRLEEDLDWLNRNPYRQVQGVFAAGDELATSNLALTVSETKPWQIYGGYSNTGTESTGKDRYYLGAAGVLRSFNHTLVSYQFTGSSDFWSHPDTITLGDDRPRYLSHSGRITIPTLPRQAIEIAPNFVASTTDSSQLGGLFVSHTETDTYEIPVLYRTALSNLFPGHYLGDLTAGVEYKHSTRDSHIEFLGLPIDGKASVDVFQFVVGWAHDLRDRFGATTFDLRLKGSPGGLLGENEDEDFAAYTGGRVTDATYLYAVLDASRVTTLPGGVNWVVQFSGVLAGDPLPDTEQMALGGFYGVRGYTLDDGAVDTGFTLRNELRLPSVSLVSSWKDSLSPYLFVDYGWGENKNTAQDDTKLFSAGVGADYRAGKHLSVGAAVGFAMKDAAVTEKGDATFHFRASLSF
ncbi:ShlB/FhaC/HecB family hemolysin secretion/activation protein [Opitutaceae bacterium TAV4]|nr:ShlB/FhaC/HecB family hemolysin secretion/activation protein [Opitutaceae bacterium TAV4]RRK02810.1 ShlB/FhaC/HecB family hemolysin secretion/activation protein [Opitutaceae bacterium TAV3]